MTRNNLHTVIAALLVAFVVSLAAIHFEPAAKDTIEKLANLVLGGLLAIMRPPSQVQQ